jgi:hypothetical protein
MGRTVTPESERSDSMGDEVGERGDRRQPESPSAMKEK